MTSPDGPGTEADSSATSELPLLVRLEGGLLRTDVSIEALVALVKARPFLAFALLWWCLRGTWREEVTRRATPDLSVLPARPEVLASIAAAREAGTPVWLITRTSASLANVIAEHFGGFDRILVGPGSPETLAGLPPHRGQAALSPERGRSWRLWPRALRVHQWAKNLLIFAPLIAAHRVFEPALLLQAILAFIAFSACASSVYLLNDLLDLPSDRRHARKSRRPFAAGTLPLGAGLAAVPVLLGGAFLLSAWALPWGFTALLAGYFTLTLAYSLALKQVALLDVLTLSGLYTLRVLGGAVATGVPASDWLLIFSIFLFLSLAMVKRVSELLKLPPDVTGAHGRGYRREDLALLGQLGSAAGYLSVLVLALFIHNPAIHRLYGHPEWLWLLCPVALYWVSRVWLFTHRGQMDEDPVVFALRDRASVVVGGLGVLILWLAS